MRGHDEWLRSLRATGGIGAYNNATLVWELYEPVAACCDRDRIGAAGDGGKYVCLPDETLLETGGGEGRRCVVYSFGSANDASFESEIVRECLGPCAVRHGSASYSSLALAPCLRGTVVLLCRRSRSGGDATTHSLCLVGEWPA